MFPGVGTVVNLIAIVLGASFGILIGAKLAPRTRSLITDVLGLTTLLAAASALTRLWANDFISSLPKGSSLLTVLAALILGGLLGSIARLEERLELLGERLRKKFRASHESRFVEGFVSASLLFAIGPLAILGSISDGMSTGIDQLLLKSSLDFFAAMAFATSLGWGVAVAVIPVAVYQGFWTVVGLLLGTVLTSYQVDAMTVTGGVLLICIGLKLLKIKDVAVANLLPALGIAPLFAWGLHSFI